MHYGTITDANEYFSTRLNTRSWDIANPADRTSALTMATKDIERLNFAGVKADENQVLQFPRGDDTDIPVDIEQATYEIALMYLDGFDLQQETNKIGVSTSVFSGTRTTYGEGFVATHIRNGIISINAWYLIFPYLRDIQQIDLSRVS